MSAALTDEELIQLQSRADNWSFPFITAEELSALIAEVRAARKAKEGWRSMESAPRDGTDIQLCSWVLHEAPNGPFAEMAVASWDVEECGGDGGWILGDYERPIETIPTHWRPLPEPPETEKDRPTE